MIVWAAARLLWSNLACLALGCSACNKHVCMLCFHLQPPMYRNMCNLNSNMFCKEYLSSIDDEECCKMHYELWIAEFREPICVWMLLAPLGYAWRLAWFNANIVLRANLHVCTAVSCKGQCICIVLVCLRMLHNLDLKLRVNLLINSGLCSLMCVITCKLVYIHVAWSEAHTPAEFKHISKWWKLNQMGFL